MKNLVRLAGFLTEERDALMERWREQVCALPSAAALDTPALNDHVPGWIADLAIQLTQADGGNLGEDAGTEPIPLAHGLQRFEDGFDIEEIVVEYGILRDCVYEIAERQQIGLAGASRRAVDTAFDEAIAGAVKAFAKSQARDVQRRRAEHLAFIAHDLRTPLSAITFSAHILQQRLPAGGDDAETARLLKTLTRNAKQLEGLVRDVLKENTQQLTELGVQLERRNFDLWPVVELLSQDLQPIAAKASTRLVNQVPDDLQVRADAGLVRRILQNLVTNALEYAPRGEVTIGARELDTGDSVECWVTDNGAGIAPERLGKVFDPLETDPQREGLGLGLAIVKTFVEAHGGTVSVESVPGQGATFRFTLPRKDLEPAPANRAAAGKRSDPLAQ